LANSISVTAENSTGTGGIKKKSAFREWSEFIGTLVLMVFFIRVTTVEAFRIPTGSMEDTMLIGDFLLVNKFIYGIRTPEWIGIPFTEIGFDIPSTRLPAPSKVKSGDIIVFKYPLDPKLNYIKRCIATPGQTIEIKQREVFIDGVKFDPPPHSKFAKTAPLSKSIHERGMHEPRGASWNHDNYGPITVPAGQYFVMGDNRDNSADSRYWGFLPEEEIVGKALIIYFSWDSTAPMSKFYNKIRWSRIGSWIH
jgi:signal peptidase I